MMSLEKKKEFLKKMGYSGGAINDRLTPKPKEKEKEKEKRANSHVDKSELLALHKIFNQPKQKDDDAE